jgi:hypothetical protein
MKNLLLVPLLIFTALSWIPTAEAETPKNLLVVTVTKGFRHSSIPTAERILEKIGKESGDFKVDYVRNDSDMASKMTVSSLEKYDGVFFANTTGDLPLPSPDAFMNWIKSGKGFMGAHSATDTFHGYLPFIDMIGGEFLTHGRQAEVEALIEDSKHPACSHLGKSWKLKDEIYILKSFHKETVHGILTLDKYPMDGSKRQGLPGNHPIAWSKNYGNGRVFYTSFGHREDVWENPIYQKHLLGGIRWALGMVEADAAPQDRSAFTTPLETEEGFQPLFNGIDLDGWVLRNPDGKKSWRTESGMLVNDIHPEIEGYHGTDLVSTESFRDFVIRYDYMVSKGSNSGMYLRGRHEIQILGDYASGKKSDGGNGGIYSVAAPDHFVSRRPGQWQEAEASIRGNRITVRLNGVLIHDNRLVDHATGGQIDDHVDAPGPIMLQGDHGSIAFRNIRIKTL